MSVFTDMRSRLASLLFRGREEAEMAEEAQLHLDMEIAAQRRRGVPLDEAHRLSRIAFGNLEAVKEDLRDARGTRMIDDTVADVRYALRGMRRNPGFVAVAIIILALGIGGTTAVFSAVDAVLLRPLPYNDPGRLVRVYATWKQAPDARSFLSPVYFLAYRDGTPSVDAMAATLTYDETGADIGSGDAAHRVRTLHVSSDYFHVLGVQPALGRGFRRDEEDRAPVAILSYRTWQDEYHGDPGVLGKSIVLSGAPATIVGVLPKGFADPISGGGVAVWQPQDLRDGLDPDNANNHYLTAIARLKPGVSIARAQHDFDAIDARLATLYESTRDQRSRIDPLQQDIVGPVSASLKLVLGAVGMVLLLVCVNIANLMLVRGSDRAREFALRSALGARGQRLARQLLIESLTLAAAGALAGLVVGRLAMLAIVRLGSDSIPRLNGLTLDGRVLLFTMLTASVSAICFGFVPAWRAAHTSPGDVLRGSGRSSTGDRSQGRIRAALVISQVALAFVLVAGAGVLLASFRELQRVALGVHTDNVISYGLALPGARYDSTSRAAFYESWAAEEEAVPGVRAAGGVSRLPATGDYNVWGTTLLTGPRAGTDQSGIQAQQRVISGHYFEALGIPLIAGRLFNAQDNNAAPHRVIISKLTADVAFPRQNPIGQRLHTGGLDAEVIGVVGDVAVTAEGTQGTTIYHSHRQFAGDRNWSLMQVVAGPAAARPATLSLTLRRQLIARDPQLVLNAPAPLGEIIGRGEAQRSFTLTILIAFAGTALVLSAVGLFGILAYVVKMRTREFGIRMALGARRSTIRLVVLRQGLLMAAAGVAAGLLGALALSRVMAALVFHVSPLDPLVLAGTALVTAGVAAVAAYLPARRATSVDPRTALQ